MYIFCFYFFVLLQTKTVILEKQINIKLFYPNEIRDYTWTTVLSKHFVSKIGIKNIHNSKVTTTKNFFWVQRPTKWVYLDCHII